MATLAIDKSDLRDMTKAELIDLAKGAGRTIAAQKRKADNVRLEAEERFGAAITAVEVAGAGFGFGFVRRRYADKFDFFGLPIEIWVGLGAHLVAWSPMTSVWSNEFRNLGNGAFCAYAYSKGFEVGERKPKTQQQAATGALPGYAPPAYTPQNDYDLAQQMRNAAAV